MGIEFDGYFYNSLADLTAYLEGLKEQEREDALAVLNAQKNTGLLEATNPELGMTSDDPDYIIDPDTGGITTTEELASQFDSSDFDYEDDVELDLGLDPIATEPIVGPDPVQYDFTDIEVEPEFEFDDQWVENQATVDEFIDKASSEVILNAPAGVYSGDEGQVVQEAADTAISSAEAALTLAENIGTQEQKDRAQELLERAEEQKSNQYIRGELIEGEEISLGADGFISTDPADAPSADVPEEEVGDVTGHDLWANGAKDKDATYYVDDDGTYHKLLADGEEETLSEKQIGQIQAKVNSGSTLSDWEENRDFINDTDTSGFDNDDYAGTTDEEQALLVAGRLAGMGGVNDVGSAATGAPELLDTLKAERAAEEAAAAAEQAARDSAEKQLEGQAKFGAEELLTYDTDPNDEEEGRENIVAELYDDTGELVVGESLDTYQEIDAALDEARAQKEEIEAFLAEEVSEGIDLDGDGIDDETLSGTQEEMLEGTVQGQLLDEQLEALTQLEADLLERADMPETSLERLADFEKALIAAGGDPEAKAMQSFWTNPKAKYDPKAQFRFRVIIGAGDANAPVDQTTGAVKGAVGMALQDALGSKGSDNPTDDAYNDMPDDTNGNVWYAKSIDKPTVQIGKFAENFHLMGQNVSQMVSLVETPTFQPVNMTLIDPSYPNATRKLLRFLRRSGYNDTTAAKVVGTGSPHAALRNSIGDVQIQQLDSDGKVLEIWWLQEAFPAEINFGKLDYSSADFVEISITWAYKSMKVQMMAHGAEEEFTYFKDYVPPKTNDGTCAGRHKAASTGISLEEWRQGLPSDDKCFLAL